MQFTVIYVIGYSLVERLCKFCNIHSVCITADLVVRDICINAKFEVLVTKRGMLLAVLQIHKHMSTFAIHQEQFTAVLFCIYFIYTYIIFVIYI